MNSVSRDAALHKKKKKNGFERLRGIKECLWLLFSFNMSFLLCDVRYRGVRRLGCTNLENKWSPFPASTRLLVRRQNRWHIKTLSKPQCRLGKVRRSGAVLPVRTCSLEQADLSSDSCLTLCAPFSTVEKSRWVLSAGSDVMEDDHIPETAPLRQGLRMGESNEAWVYVIWSSLVAGVLKLGSGRGVSVVRAWGLRGQINRMIGTNYLF